jgi:apolipoprotein N-acyltransferase
MICQDDNYEDVARRLALAGVGVVAVPTFDWKGVARAHLNSARNRPRDFGYVEARAAIGGISAVIDGSGRVLASRNHFTEGDGCVVASVALGAGVPAPFARTGLWAWPALAGISVVGAVIALCGRGKKCESLGKYAPGRLWR